MLAIKIQGRKELHPKIAGEVEGQEASAFFTKILHEELTRVHNKNLVIDVKISIPHQRLTNLTEQIKYRAPVRNTRSIEQEQREILEQRFYEWQWEWDSVLNECLWKDYQQAKGKGKAEQWLNEWEDAGSSGGIMEANLVEQWDNDFYKKYMRAMEHYRDLDAEMVENYESTECLQVWDKIHKDAEAGVAV